MSRRRVIAGNWKLNMSPVETRAYLEDFLPRVDAIPPESIAIFPPSISLTTARDALVNRSPIALGVQNLYWEQSGAFTGEISAPLAAAAGATLALVGHSERRHIFGETDSETARKVDAVVDAGMTAYLCVGETLEEREAGMAADVVSRQLGAVLDRDRRPPVDRLVIAYEPVWAIGTGRSATPDDAGQMHAKVRETLATVYGEQATSIPILYGGSVNPDNAEALLAASDVDGLLVGGASLEPGKFASICALIA